METFKAQLKEYEQVVEILKNQPICQFLSVGENENMVIKTFDNLIENPKIYS